MSTNLSKQKRGDLLSKISAIRAFISTAPQAGNTGSLLTYLSDLERDVNGKKHGLVEAEPLGHIPPRMAAASLPACLIKGAQQ